MSTHVETTVEKTAENAELVVGIFDTRGHAEAAIAELEASGFSPADIGIAARDDHGELTEFRAVEAESGTKRGAVAGAAAGIGVGGLWALGIAAGVLPALGPIIAGGWMASLLASAATGAAAGGLMGALV
jgi:hypothetical protein